MMRFEDVQVQLVDLPPVHPDFPESWLYQIIRNADAALLVVDLSDPDLLEDLETTLAQLAKAKVQLGAGELPNTPGWLAKNALLVANKLDAGGALESLEILKELYGARFESLPVSAETGARTGRTATARFRVAGGHPRLHQSPRKETGADRALHPEARIPPSSTSRRTSIMISSPNSSMRACGDTADSRVRWSTAITCWRIRTWSSCTGKAGARCQVPGARFQVSGVRERLFARSSLRPISKYAGITGGGGQSWKYSPLPRGEGGPRRRFFQPSRDG